MAYPGETSAQHLRCARPHDNSNTPHTAWAYMCCSQGEYQGFNPSPKANMLKPCHPWPTSVLCCQPESETCPVAQLILSSVSWIDIWRPSRMNPRFPVTRHNGEQRPTVSWTCRSPAQPCIRSRKGKTAISLPSGAATHGHPENRSRKNSQVSQVSIM